MAQPANTFMGRSQGVASRRARRRSANASASTARMRGARTPISCGPSAATQSCSRLIRSPGPAPPPRGAGRPVPQPQRDDGELAAAGFRQIALIDDALVEVLAPAQVAQAFLDGGVGVDRLLDAHARLSPVGGAEGAYPGGPD